MRNERIHEERLEVGDALGQILATCHAAEGASGVAFELVERSDGHLGVADAARYFAGLDEWTETSRFACEQAPGRVLDIAAGAGAPHCCCKTRATMCWPSTCQRARRGCANSAGVGKAFTGTVFELAATRPERFDTFLMLGNSLGLLGGAQQAPAFLDALTTIAAPGARILGETLDPYRTSDPDHLDYHEENRRAGRLAGQLRLRVRHLRLTTPWLDYLF